VAVVLQQLALVLGEGRGHSYDGWTFVVFGYSFPYYFTVLIYQAI
jgi:hypothetical protein